MAILLTSGNPLGLRAVGSGGRTAIASVEQITRTLRQTLGPEHAALFAEPSRRADSIDWFAEAEVGTSVARILEAPEERRERGLERLERLVRDISAKAVMLQKSDRQDERILGEMLSNALEIPDEAAVYMVGEQPVMTFWGYVKDRDQPPVSPLQTLLRRRSGAAARLAAEAAAAAAPAAGATPRRGWAARLPSGLLWILLLLLLATSAAEVLRGCAIGLPHVLTGWLIDFCPVTGGAGLSAALAAEGAQQARLQAEFEDLIRKAALKRQACLVTPGKDQTSPAATPIVDAPKDKPVAPDQPETKPAPAGPDQQLKIPPKPDGSTGFLVGCWRAGEGLTETIAGKDTGNKLDVTFCFKPDGTGTKTFRFEADGVKCVASVKAALKQDVLTIDVDEAPCQSNHVGFEPTVDTCRQGDGGAAVCEETPKGGTKPNFSNIPFTHVDDQP